MEKILIIDDDVDMCLLLKLFLSRKGYEVVGKYSGAAGIECIEQFQPDLVICDLQLTDTTGIEVLKKVKEIDNNLPVIIITAYDDTQVSAKTKQGGAYDYVTKPILPEGIYSIAQQAIRKKNAGEEPSKKTISPESGSDDIIVGRIELLKRIPR